MTKVPIRIVVSDLWADLTASQKWIFGSLVMLVFAFMISGWIDSFQAHQEIRGYENAAIQANREKIDALEKAAKVASDIKVREEELAKVEVIRDAKRDEVKKAGDDVRSDRAEYDRAVRQRRPDVPSTDKLCAELAALGYPCQPR